LPTDENQITCDVATLAACLGVTDRTIQRLAQAGTVVRVNRSQYDLPASVKGYLQKIESEYTDNAEFRKSKQRALDIDNERKQLELDKASGEVYDRATIDRDFTVYVAEVVKLHKSFVPFLKKRNPKIPQRVWDAIETRLAGIREAAKKIRISDEAIS